VRPRRVRAGAGLDVQLVHIGHVLAPLLTHHLVGAQGVHHEQHQPVRSGTIKIRHIQPDNYNERNQDKYPYNGIATNTTEIRSSA